MLVTLIIMNLSTQAVTIGVLFITVLEINGMCNYDHKTVITMMGAGHVFVHPVDETSVDCGEVTRIVCNATDTNVVTITAHNETAILGEHTYERGSPRVATAGTLNLYLVEAVVSSRNAYLTNFNVLVSETYTGGTTYVTCIDAYDSKNVSIVRSKLLQSSIINSYTVFKQEMIANGLKE